MLKSLYLPTAQYLWSELITRALQADFVSLLKNVGYLRSVYARENKQDYCNKTTLFKANIKTMQHKARNYWPHKTNTLKTVSSAI